MLPIDLINAAGSLGAQSWPGGSGAFNLSGTFGGASVRLQWSADGQTWTAVGQPLTAAGSVTFTRGAGYLQASVTGGSGVSLAGSVERSETPLLCSTADGSTGSTQWDGGNGVFSAVGAFGAGSLQLEYLGPDNETWLTVGAPLTAAGMQDFSLPRGQIQATVTGATNPAITATAAPLPLSLQ